MSKYLSVSLILFLLRYLFPLLVKIMLVHHK